MAHADMNRTLDSMGNIISLRMFSVYSIRALMLSSVNALFSDTKCLIGRRFSDPSVQNYMKLWPFKVTEGPAEKPMIVVTHEGQEKTVLS
ncbi:hypothetical protein ACFX16_001279 [Malus domestica]